MIRHGEVVFELIGRIATHLADLGQRRPPRETLTNVERRRPGEASLWLR